MPRIGCYDHMLSFPRNIGKFIEEGADKHIDVKTDLLRFASLFKTCYFRGTQFTKRS